MGVGEEPEDKNAADLANAAKDNALGDGGLIFSDK